MQANCVVCRARDKPGIRKRFIDKAGLDKPGHRALGRERVISGAPEHGQLPFGVGFVQAEDVHALVTAFEFDVAIVSSVPPIERFDDIDLTPVEVNSLRYRDPMVVRRELNLNTHDLCGSDPFTLWQPSCCGPVLPYEGGDFSTSLNWSWRLPHSQRSHRRQPWSFQNASRVAIADATAPERSGSCHLASK